MLLGSRLVGSAVAVYRIRILIFGGDKSIPAIDHRIADLERRLKQAKALKQQQVAREKAAERKRQRSADTRRKILVGAVILAKVEHGEWPKERLHDLMDKALIRADDRALFGLLPVPSDAETQTGLPVEPDR